MGRSQGRAEARGVAGEKPGRSWVSTREIQDLETASNCSPQIWGCGEGVEGTDEATPVSCGKAPTREDTQ